MQKLSTFLLALIACAGTMFADYVQIGDLYYNLNADDLTAEVTYQEQLSPTNYSYLTVVNIPESVEYNSVTYSVTSIGSNAFYGCSGLTSISIPNSVTSIGLGAFEDCTGLTSITCHALTPPTCGNYVFNNVDKSIPLYVPEESIELYQTANVWNEFTNIQAISTVDIDQIQLNSTVKNHKILYNGSVYILTGDKTYTVTGQQLK